MRVDPASFEDLYAADGDPWSFATSEYELGRYRATLDLLAPSYRRGFEPGCSVGVLTERIAERCAALVAVDPSPTAVAVARRRLAGRDHVEVEVGAIPEWWPAGTFDLVVFSELGYYWDRPGLASLLDAVDELIEPGGDLVAVHWLGDSTDHVLHGDDVHAMLDEHFGAPAVALRRPGFVAARWRR